MVSDVVSEFTAGDASCGALSSSRCKVPPSRTSLLDPRLALQTDRGKECWSHGCVLVQCLKHKVLINALGCLFQFLKDASVHPPCVSHRSTPKTKAGLPRRGLKQWLLDSNMKNKRSRNHRCKHSGKQLIFFNNTKQRLPVSICISVKVGKIHSV